MSRKPKTPLMLVLDSTLAGCAEDIEQSTAAAAIREHETLMLDLIAANETRDTLTAENRALRSALFEAERAYGNLHAAAMQHHATSKCDSKALHGSAERGLMAIDAARAALARVAS